MKSISSIYKNLKHEEPSPLDTIMKAEQSDGKTDEQKKIEGLQATITILKKDLANCTKENEKAWKEADSYRAKASQRDDYKIGYDEMQRKFFTLQEASKKMEEELLATQSSVDKHLESVAVAESNVAEMKRRLNVKNAMFKQLKGFFAWRLSTTTKNANQINEIEIKRCLEIIESGLISKLSVKSTGELVSV